MHVQNRRGMHTDRLMKGMCEINLNLTAVNGDRALISPLQIEIEP